ncbi:uncharacterized protein [Physcomitrium patens]|uniref:uncharacterized protein isoform X1 n=2 Tax=Physcomitrium patens TaxID=3218 RepID=UPI003CCD976D
MFSTCGEKVKLILLVYKIKMGYLLELFKKFIYMVWGYLHGLFMSRSSSTMEQYEKMSNIQGICGDTWEGSKVYIGAFKVLLKKKNMLNRNQCTNLCKKIENVTKVFDHLMTCTNDKLEFGLLLSELFFIMNKSYFLVKKCGKPNWCEEAIFQFNNKETFRELILDLKCCSDIASNFLLKHYPNKFEDIIFATFNVATCQEVEVDVIFLHELLIHASKEEDFEHHASVKHLLQRYKDLYYIEIGELDALNFTIDMTSLEIIEYVKGKPGTFGEVYKSKWLGLLCATKKIDVAYDKLFIKEVNILASISHPNLITYYFAMKDSVNGSVESFETKDKKEYLYIGMELMENNLSNMLKEEKEVSYIFLIDIMHQIAKGMCYLHDMHIAHRDLKPENILVNIVESKIKNKIVRHAIVKVIDFGMSKIEVGRNSIATENNYIYGTPKYMAPEALKNRFQTMAMCPFEADVYSFAMICSKILSKKDPFYDALGMKDILERIEKGERLKLPSNCDDLIELIRECWRLNPLHRPKFATICERLNLLKCKFLVGMNVPNAPYFGVSKNNYHQNEELQQILYQLPKVDLLDEDTFGREQYLSRIKKECVNKMKVLCLIGMGGIGKTTIAKAMLADVKDIYDASCFVECIENGVDCFTTSCNILEQFKVKSKPRNVEEAQKMLKSFLMKNKTIFVFDNVKNQSQIEDVVPMDDIYASNGSTLVTTTRDSKTIEHYGKEVCIINIEELNEETSMKLFNTHSCGQENLPNELVEVGEKIVKACHGLPLSLKVMGAFLRENKRLRCWERALQKLKRGRELDGDENNSNYKIWKILRVSFDNLKDEEKKMFMDICCFFSSDVYPQGMSKGRALRMWANSQKNIFEQDMEVILNTLIYQSLVKIDKDKIIRIHDQLQDMGRNIVEKEMEYKYTRMWNLNVDLFYGFSNKLEGLFYNNVNNNIISKIRSDSFSSLQFLSCTIGDFAPNIIIRILSIFFVLIKHSLSLKCFLLDMPKKKKLPRESTNKALQMLHDIDVWKKLESLNILQLRNCSFIEIFPNSFFRIATLLELDLEGCSNLTMVPNDLEYMTSLKILNLKDCKQLHSLPTSIGSLLYLKNFNISGCSNLTSLPNELGNLISLTYFDVSWCSSLTTLPNELGNLRSLITFDIRICSSLTSLPNEFGNLTSLTTFIIRGCSSLTSLPNELGNLISLTYFDVSWCSSLTSLPNELGNLTSLTTFIIKGCSGLTSLPNELRNLTSLTTFDVSRCSSLTSLPNELGNLTSLTTFIIRGCSSLTSLPNELGNLISLTKFDISECSRLTSLLNKLGNLTSLTTFDIRECSRLTSLPNELGNLTSLTTFDICECSKLTSLPNELGNLTSLTTFDISECSSLTSLPNELGNLTSLTIFFIRRCSSLTSLPNELGNLTSLTKFDISECSRLTSLSNELGNLTSLTTFFIRRCLSLTSLPNELGNLISLTYFDVSWCSSLISLPNKLSNLTSLTTFIVKGCSGLTLLPNELGNLTSLTTFDISRCSSLTSLPNELGNLTSLTTFIIRGCSSLTSLPNELGNLTSLTKFDISECSRLTSLPNELGNLTSLTTFFIRRCSSLTSLPNELANLTSLTIFDISRYSSLTSLPHEFGNLTSLTTLCMWGCLSLTSLRNELGNLISLTYFDASWCSSLTSLPNELGNLTSLTTFIIKGCSRLTSLANELSNLTSLTTFDVSRCSSLTSLPNELGNLTSLTTFIIRGCSSLTSLPNELGNLTSLTKFDISECSRLTSLPNELGNLTSLTTFFIRRCSSLTSLPNELGNLTSLTTFDICECTRLTSLPNKFGNLKS